MWTPPLGGGGVVVHMCSGAFWEIVPSIPRAPAFCYILIKYNQMCIRSFKNVQLWFRTSNTSYQSMKKHWYKYTWNGTGKYPTNLKNCPENSAECPRARPYLFHVWNSNYYHLGGFFLLPQYTSENDGTSHRLISSSQRIFKKTWKDTIQGITSD